MLCGFGLIIRNVRVWCWGSVSSFLSVCMLLIKSYWDVSFVGIDNWLCILVFRTLLLREVVYLSLGHDAWWLFQYSSFTSPINYFFAIRIRVVEKLWIFEFLELKVSIHFIYLILLIQKLLVNVSIVDIWCEGKNAGLLLNFFPVDIGKPRGVFNLFEVRNP